MKQSYNFAEKRNLFAAALGLVAALAAPAAQAQVVTSTPKLEAELGVITGAGAKVSTDPPGFSGAGYVDYNGTGSGVAFKYTAATAGVYEILIRYSSKFGEKLGDLIINGGPRSQLYFNSTATGNAFRSASLRRITLVAGENTISIEKGYNYYGIDYIQIAPVATTVTALTLAATTGRVEAEAGQLTQVQAFVREGDATTHSGASYVGLFAEDKTLVSSITLPVNVATAGLYQIAVGARNQGTESNKQLDLAVATATSPGSKLTTVLGPASPDFKSYPIGKYNLTAGTNTITISSQTGFLEVDYVDLTATTGVATAAKAGAADQLALSAYPNPTNGQALRVSLEAAAAQAATFDLVNALGQRVLSTSRSLKAGSNQLQLATERLGSGIYQLIVRRGDQPLLVKRVVLN